MNIHYAYRVAAGYDFNRDGYIDTRGFSKEIKMDSEARALTDFNRDGHITVNEFAHSLNRGDVYIGHDNKVRSSRQPFVGRPGYGNRYPNNPYQYNGPGYGYGYGGGYQQSPYGNVFGGAAVGGAIGYMVDGNDGLGKGAVIGGFIGALGNLFN